MEESTVGHIRVTELKTMADNRGFVRHGLREDDCDYRGFGEVYFSGVAPDTVKGWKMHRRMNMNIIGISGDTRFLFLDRAGGRRVEVTGESRSCRLFVPAGIWFAFKASSNGGSVILNFSDIKHDPEESEVMPFDGGSF